MFFFFNDTATTEIYTLSLHDALPISRADIFCASELLFNEAIKLSFRFAARLLMPHGDISDTPKNGNCSRSEEHTSELQSLTHLVCPLLLHKHDTKPGHASLTYARVFI